MRSVIEAALGDHSIYQARRKEYDTGKKIPFRVSPTPFQLTREQKHEVQAIGFDITNYLQAVDELYRTDTRVQSLLNTGKPEIFLIDQPTRYLFVRPDLIITPSGFSICEVETSPFGLALAEVLNRGYQNSGFETLVSDGALPKYVQANTPVEGRIIYSQKTGSYSGQMTFLAEEVFSDSKNAERKWQATMASNTLPEQGNIYHGFYLAEHLSDPSIKQLLDAQIKNHNPLLPSPTPHMEEKANLSLIWDKRFEQHFIKVLGYGAFHHLREVIPPTWIVGQEEHFAPGLPSGISTSIDLASLSRANRAFVLKPSGFTNNSSWAEGVSLLQEKSADNALLLLKQAQSDTSGLHVVQEFKKGVKVPLEYENDGKITPMTAKIRLTPYFSMASGQEGKLIAIKATGCENTDLIHASSTSINTAVS